MKRSLISRLIVTGLIFLGYRLVFNRPDATSVAPSSSSPSTALDQGDRQATTQEIEQRIHEQINAYRKTKGLSPLNLDERITQESRIYSAKMASGEATFSHDGFEQRSKNLTNKALKHSNAGENLAYLQGYEDLATTAVKGWIASPGHHENIVGDFNTTGIGVAPNEEGTYYFTQIFVKQLSPENDVSTAEIERRIHQQINAYRTKRGLPTLQLDYRITQEAQRFSAKMAAGEAEFSHAGFDGRIENLTKQAISYSRAGENLAFLQGYDDYATTAVEGWIASPGHHENIIADFDKTGIGVVANEDGEYYFTQLFIKSR